MHMATRILGVSESGYHEHRGRGPSARDVRHTLLTDLIRKVHIASRGTYGARRVRAELTRTRRRCRSPKISIRSVTSVRTVNTKRSAKQFARGHRGGILTYECQELCVPHATC